MAEHRILLFLLQLILLLGCARGLGLLFSRHGQPSITAEILVGILFFLLDTGLQTDFAAAWRQRRSAIIISFSDLLLPMLIAFVPCLLLPSSFLVNPQERVLFAVFIATIMTISALPVTARVLQELHLYRTDIGLLIMGALTINDEPGCGESIGRWSSWLGPCRGLTGTRRTVFPRD